MGASTAYQMFAGLAEVLAGLLLLFRRTALLGALLCGGVLANVVLLNFCFDVPVKIYSSHLLLMAVCIIYPDTGRLVSFFLLSREEDSLHERSQRRRSIGQQLFVTLLKMAMCAVIALLPAVQNWQYMVQTAYGNRLRRDMEFIEWTLLSELAFWARIMRIVLDG